MTLADADALFVMFSDAQARRYYPQMESSDAVRGWIDWNLENYCQHGFGLWAIVLKDTGAFVGDCGLTFQPVGDDTLLEIGYHVTLEHRGRGYAVEAAQAALQYGFEITNQSQVCSIVAPDNVASIRVAKKVHQKQRAYSDHKGDRRLLFYSLRSPNSQLR